MARSYVVFLRGVFGERVGAVGDLGYDVDAVIRL